jgi:hypothetical protein
MEITEEALLDGYDGKAGPTNISIVDVEEIYWCYRRGEQDDGYNPVRLDRNRARVITLEFPRRGHIPLHADCDDHPSLALIATDEANLWGDHV